MCDVSVRRSSCHGTSGHWLKPIKLSKWELPIRDSGTYWTGVCDEIEKKYKRVRDPYPSSISQSPPSVTSPQIRLPDDIRFKISPPTPLHKMRKFVDKFKSSKVDKNLLTISDRKKFGGQLTLNQDKLKLPPANTSKRKINIIDDKKPTTSREVKIYSKSSCPRHKNIVATKIFDDEIAKYLHIRKTSVPKLPSVSKPPCDHHKMIRSRSASASTTRSKSFETKEGKIVKPPKLGMASLVPSFAKAVSIDSSAGTRESLDLDEEFPKLQSDKDSIVAQQRTDFLRVPNLKFASAHPSFRKLSLVDSRDEEDSNLHDISVMSEEDFLNAEKSLKSEKKVLTFKDEVVKKEEKITKTKDDEMSITINVDTSLTKKISDPEREYAYKALDKLTNNKYTEVKMKTKVSWVEKSSSSEESQKSNITKTKHRKIRTKKDENDSIDFREVQNKLKNIADLQSGLIKKPDSEPTKLDTQAAVTIMSASRSTSGSSVDFENNAVAALSANVLEQIPETKVFCRSYIDKCHACIYKPFKSETKINRKLPLATLKSIVDKPNSPNISYSSSSSSSNLIDEELQDYSDYDTDDKDIYESLEYDGPISGVRTESEISYKKIREESDSKDYLRVFFEKNTLTSESATTTDTSSTKDKLSSSKSQADQRFKEKSFSLQSSDRSKTSTPSNQSSDSEEARPQEDKLPSSKIMAPCHAPVVWRPSLEPLRALRSKKFMTLRARADAITAKSSEGSESESEEEIVTPRAQKKKQEEASAAHSGKTEEKKEKKKKPLLRMKTAIEKITAFTTSYDAGQVRDAKSGRMLKRAKTTFHLKAASEESKTDESEDEQVAAKPETKEEPIPYFDAILKHRAASPPPPIMSPQDVIDLVKTCLEDEYDPSHLLDKLSSKFIEKIEEKCKTLDDGESVKYLKLGLKLFKSLADSRRYLKSDVFDPNLEFSSQQPPVTNSRQLRRVLPPKAYDLVAPILGMPKCLKADKGARMKFQRSSSESEDTVSERTFDLIVHPPTDRESSSDKYGVNYGVNPYALFLKKPRRKAVVWRPLREEDLRGYDPEATLEMRAARLMDKICKDFCEWLKQLGGNEQVVDEEILKDMFEINFTAEACKAMQVVLTEMPTVPPAVVSARHCREANELEATRARVHEDLRTELRPERKHAFGSALPRELRFVPPRNRRLAEKWTKCEHVAEDLANMDVVWQGISHLESVRAFVDFLKENPGVAPPKLLRNLEQRKQQNNKCLEVENSLAQIHFETEKIREPPHSEDDSAC